MKKLWTIGIILLICLTTPVLSSTISNQSIDELNDNDALVDHEENAFGLRVWVIAFPKVFISGKPVFLKVVFPMFLINGFIHYDFNDGTFQDTKNFAKHVFFESGTYQVQVEFDTIFGIKATGSTRVFII